MKVWVTKYALTKGIIEEDVTECDNGMVRVTGKWYGAYYHRGEWFRTREEANTRVLEMIASKRKSLTKQLAKLDKLEKQIRN